MMSGPAAIQQRGPAPPMARAPDSNLSTIPGTWAVLHVKSRHEKALACDLYRLGLDYFLPMVCRRRSHGGRLARVLVPLFPGYIFVAWRDHEDRYRALATHRVARVIEVADQTRIVRELEQIRRAVHTPHQVDLYPGIKRGRRCRVVGGSLEGLEGVVVMRRGSGRIHLEMHMLGRSAVVEIDAMLLEPVH